MKKLTGIILLFIFLVFYSIVNASNHRFFTIVDPTFSGSVHLSPRQQNIVQLASYKNYVYVPFRTSNLSGGISVVDITHTDNPTIISTFITSSYYPRHLIRRGKYLYVSGYVDNMMHIINISNPSSPHEVGKLSMGTSSTPFIMRSDGRYIYALSAYMNTVSPNKLQVIDAFNPTSLSIVGTLAFEDGSHNALEMDIQGDYLYFSTTTSDSFFTIVNISNPTTPTTVYNGLVTGYTYAHTCVVGDYAYLSIEADHFNNSWIRSYDISDPTTPVYVSSLQLSEGGTVLGQGSVCAERYMFMSTDTSPTQIIIADISNPASMTVVNSLTLPNGNDGSGEPLLRGNLLFVPFFDSTVGGMAIINLYD